jgi:hypothetical protein
MREQQSVLRDEADGTQLRRKMLALRRVDERDTVELDPAGVGRSEPRDDGERRGLAAARWSEQRSDRVVAIEIEGECDIEREPLRQTAPHPNVEVVTSAPAGRGSRS